MQSNKVRERMQIAHWPKGKRFTGYGPNDTPVCHGYVVWRGRKGICDICQQKFQR